MGYYIGDVVEFDHMNGISIREFVIIGKRIYSGSVLYRVAATSIGAARTPFEYGNYRDIYGSSIKRKSQTMSREEMLLKANPLIRRAGLGENINGITSESKMPEGWRKKTATLTLYRKGW